MKVILSVEAIRYPLTGTGRYAYELARHLDACRAVEELRFFAGGRFVALPGPDDGGGALGARLRRLLQRNDAVVALRQALVNRRAGRALSGHDDHVFHGPNFYLPPRAGRNVVTIHDLSIFTMPECHPPERVRFMRGEIGKALERARRVITDCAFMRQEVARYFDWPTARIEAIPLAAGEAFRPHPPEALTAALSPYGLAPDGYVLFTGTIEPRKNLGRLIAAYAALPAALRGRVPLVVVGHRGWRSEAVHAAMERGRAGGWLHYVGYAPQADLPALFAGARLFVMPSLYEGFGLPLLEAMASGTATLAADAASLPEIAGDAAILFDPRDTAAIASALERGLDDAAWRRASAAAGLRRSADYSWQRCAAATVEAYRRTAAE